MPVIIAQLAVSSGSLAHPHSNMHALPHASPWYAWAGGGDTRRLPAFAYFYYEFYACGARGIQRGRWFAGTAKFGRRGVALRIARQRGATCQDTKRVDVRGGGEPGDGGGTMAAHQLGNQRGNQ